MRYLNKIVFINSASVQYAEMELDGNVHLTGTQGVGKSTLLRAILFFYNANKIKLGIPREKQSFDEYYFPFQNSYIIYEIVKEEATFCVLAYKVNGKTAFRFFDSEYKRELFIDENNRAFQSWDEIRTAFGRHIYYTPIVASYKEFRQIIYGDNKGMKPNFRKYALLESKQYQNIPLTIQNVFLNSKLEAKFIKETIIKSLNEEEFSLDLENYLKNHLRDFESQINDISIWFKKNKKGQIIIRKQAEKIIDLYRKFNFLKQEKQELTAELAGRMEFVEQEKPKLIAKLNREGTSLDKLKEEGEKLKKLHSKREQKLISEIDYLKKELRKTKKKQDRYAAQNIEEVIQKVEQKNNWISKKKSLEEEKSTLTAAFADIEQRFENLIRQVQNQLVESKNEKEAAINKIERNFTKEETDLTNTYRGIIDQIEEGEKDQLENVQNEKETLVGQENQLHIKKSELKHQRFFEKEIEDCLEESAELKQAVSTYKNEIEKRQSKKDTLRKQGELETEKVKQYAENKIDKSKEKQEKYRSEILGIQHKIKQSESSLYGWLDKNVPNWGETIGKVIDEEEVLFHTDLNPKLSNEENHNFFGIELNLNALKSRVKTLEEYRQDIEVFQKKVEEIRKEINRLEEQKNADLSRINKRFKRKLSRLEDEISEKEYKFTQDENRLKKNKVALEEWKEKGKTEKKSILEDIEQKLNKTASEKLKVEKEQQRILKSISRQISLKNTERDKKINELKTEKTWQIQEIKNLFKGKETVSTKRIQELKNQQHNEFSRKGADTKRIREIEEELLHIEQELSFIKENEALVIEYKKDKREFFDKVQQWKTEQKNKENQKENILEVHQKEQQKADKKYRDQRTLVNTIKDSLEVFSKDEAKFSEFKKLPVYLEMEPFLIPPKNQKSFAKLAVNSINELTGKHYEGIETLNSLKQAVGLFTGNFSANNIFNFEVNLNIDKEFLEFAVELKEFIEEDKIAEYEKRVNNKFADVIHNIGKETNELLSKEAEIEKVIRKINNDFETKNFVEAIKEMEMRTQKSSNPIVRLLIRIKDFNEENNLILGEINLFNVSGNSTQNQKAVNLLKQLVKELERYKHNSLSLSESFDLQFRIVENDNNSGWVEKLSNVGSEGTDVLVKAMINILLLNVFKSDVSKKFKDFKLHCMMDEIGRLHPTNVKGILRFANERNIFLINGSPISQSATDYKYTYKLSKHKSQSDPNKYITKVNRLVKVRNKVLSR